MQVSPTALSGCLMIEPRVLADERGFFLETYQRERYFAAGVAVDFVQDNHSLSHRGTLRGLHYQIDRPQGKLVWAVRGEVFDVAVDLRDVFAVSYDRGKYERVLRYGSKPPVGLAEGDEQWASAIVDKARR